MQDAAERVNPMTGLSGKKTMILVSVMAGMGQYTAQTIRRPWRPPAFKGAPVAVAEVGQAAETPEEAGARRRAVAERRQALEQESNRQREVLAARSLEQAAIAKAAQVARIEAMKIARSGGRRAPMGTIAIPADAVAIVQVLAVPGTTKGIFPNHPLYSVFRKWLGEKRPNRRLLREFMQQMQPPAK